MIIAIESSIPTFKSVTFRAGLNVLLADTTPRATEKQTRNSAGKTSLVEIIHFLLGSKCHPDSLFRIKALIEHSFLGTFDIGGERLRVSRSGSDQGKILVLEGGEQLSELVTKIDKNSGQRFVTLGNWRTFLGHAMFGLPSDLEGSVFEGSFTPTFRAMFAYFVRRRNSGAFITAQRQAEKQARWDWQVNLSYLLGLDWQIPYAFQKVRKRESMLRELKTAAKGGALGDIVGTVAELRPQVTLAETAAVRRREQLGHFEVLESYRDLAARAARAKTDMQARGREAVGLNETLFHLERALAIKAPPARSDLERLYAAAEVELPGIALQQIEDVERFYDSVVRNRRIHLEQEIADARERLTESERQMAGFDTERKTILQELEGRGALEDFLVLQRELAALEANAAALRERFKTAEILEGEGIQLVIDRANLKRRLQEDHQQRKDALDYAIIMIAEAIGDLYEDRQGRFVVEATENGPEFSISIEGDRGGGIANMEIFCFDLALLRIVTKRLGGPGFLIHDSHLFDGVDERQVARALMLGQRVAEAFGQQYIVTMNSDIFDRLPLPDGVDREKFVLPTRLSDETETGGLFGFRFD